MRDGDAGQALGDELVPVRTPLGDAWALARDEPSLRAEAATLPLPGLDRAIEVAWEQP